ncbi:MAG: hypothetical protein ABJA98_17600 [Acidobacteriota bacterium]
MKSITWDTSRRVLLGPRFFVEHPAWNCSPLATKLFLFLVSKANHPPTDIEGETVGHGQYRRSLRLLAKDLRVKDPRSISKALAELCSVGCISMARSTPQAVASNASGSAVAFDAQGDRKTSLVTICDFNHLSAAVALNASQSTYYVSSTGRRRSQDRPSSVSADQRNEIQLIERARMRAEKHGLEFEDVLRQLRSEAGASARRTQPHTTTSRETVQ